MKFGFAIISLMVSVAVHAADTPFYRTCIDDDWQFALNDSSALGASFDKLRINSPSTLITLPHDWAVEQKGDVGPFFKDGDYQTGFMKGGTGWYRKDLLPVFNNMKKVRDCRTGKIYLYFEGVYNQSVVYVNGKEIASSHYGYNGFRIDITRLFSASEPTALDLTVKVTNQGKNSRWYAGAGIFRHVWIEHHGDGCIDPWDVQIKTESLDKYKAVVSFNVKGKKLFTREIRNPHLWSPDDPYLYTMKVDGNEFRYGIRTIAYSAEKGFLLNGKPVLLKGGCVHHDNGLLGASALDRAEDRKLQLMKDQGYNAVRCSHNLQSEHFMNACDSLGLMVIDECFDQWFDNKNPDDYHNYFPEHYKEDIAFMVRRDRNHPSVIMWSIGNEIPGRHSERGQDVAAQMREVILSLDDSRPLTAALCGWDNRKMDWKQDAPLAWKSLDITGYNYLWREYTQDHKNHPNLVMVGTESYPQEAAVNWQAVEKYPYVIGDFVWTAWDYLGEAGIGHSLWLREGEENPFFMPWPYFNGWCGDIDLIGEKKPQSYVRDVVWGRVPITMNVMEPVPVSPADSVQAIPRNIVSGWGWPLEHHFWSKDSVMTVNVYSRQPKVRLYLDNKLIGTQSTDKNYKATFQVPYLSSTGGKSGGASLRAVTWDGKKEGDSAILARYGTPVALRVRADRTRIHADGQDLSFVTIELVDSLGNLVPETGRKIRIECNAPFLAGNASPSDMESFRSSAPSLFEGRAQAIIRATRKLETINLRVTSDGLPPKQLDIKTTRF